MLSNAQNAIYINLNVDEMLPCYSMNTEVEDEECEFTDRDLRLSLIGVRKGGVNTDGYQTLEPIDGASVEGYDILEGKEGAEDPTRGYHTLEGCNGDDDSSIASADGDVLDSAAKGEANQHI